MLQSVRNRCHGRNFGIFSYKCTRYVDGVEAYKLVQVGVSIVVQRQISNHKGRRWDLLDILKSVLNKKDGMNSCM